MDSLSTLDEYQPSARYAVEHAAGYAAFSSVGIKLLFAGGKFTGAVSVMPGVFVYQITDTALAAQITASETKFFKDDSLNWRPCTGRPKGSAIAAIARVQTCAIFESVTRPCARYRTVVPGCV